MFDEEGLPKEGPLVSALNAGSAFVLAKGLGGVGFLVIARTNPKVDRYRVGIIMATPKGMTETSFVIDPESSPEFSQAIREFPLPRADVP